jgi:ABC-type polysaccharide/polyol phosphate export permease
MFSNLLALTVFSFGFRRLVGEGFALNLSIGWIALSMVTIGVGATIVMTIDLTVSQIHYLLSLPVSLRSILIGKIGSVVALATCASFVVLLCGQFLLLHTTAERLLLLFVALILQALTLVGMLSTTTVLVRDLTKLAVLTNFLIGVLQYASVVYFPIASFPIYVRPILYLNPLTYAINFSRTLLVRGEIDLIPLAILAGWSIFWTILGYRGLERRIERAR